MASCCGNIYNVKKHVQSMERRKLGGSTPNVNVGRSTPGGQRKCGSRDEKEGRGSSGAQPVVGMIHLQGGVFFTKKRFSTEKYSWEWVSFFLGGGKSI